MREGDVLVGSIGRTWKASIKGEQPVRVYLCVCERWVGEGDKDEGGKGEEDGEGRGRKEGEGGEGREEEETEKGRERMGGVDGKEGGKEARKKNR